MGSKEEGRERWVGGRRQGGHMGGRERGKGKACTAHAPEGNVTPDHAYKYTWVRWAGLWVGGG